MEIEQLGRRIAGHPFKGRRRLVAIAGPPASGKSTLAAAVVHQVPNSCVVPMDGFHLDNSILEQRGLLTRKGSPDSFDAMGFKHLIIRLTQEDEVVFPVFDRNLDRAIAGAGVVAAETQTVVVEGNYLLLDAPIWRDLGDYWDDTVQLEVPMPVLKKRLTQRWVDHGFTHSDALAKAAANDLPNAKFVAQHSRPAQVVLRA